MLAMAALGIAGCSNGTSSGGCKHHHERRQRQQSLKDNQDASKTIRTAIDAIDGGDLAKAKSICDDLVDNDWDNLCIYDKCDIAYCYARTLGPLGPSATDIDRFRHCLESVSAEDRDAAARCRGDLRRRPAHTRGPRGCIERCRDIGTLQSHGRALTTDNQATNH